MKLFLSTLTFASLFWASAVSAANLNIPMAFEYLALDGQQVKKTLFKHKSKLKLSQGHHEIAIRYLDMVESDVSDTEEGVKSAAFIITLNAADDVDYFLEVAGDGKIRNPWEFAKAPDVVVTRKGGEPVEYKLTHTDITDKSFATQLYGQAPQEAKPAVTSHSEPTTAAAAAAYSSSPAAVSTAVVASTSSPAPTSDSSDADENTATPGQMLHLWWQRADENTRKEFLSWAIKEL